MTPPWPGDPEFARQAALTASFAADFARRNLVAAALNAMQTNPQSQAPIVASIVAADTVRKNAGQTIECDPSVSITPAGLTITGTRRPG